MQQSLAKPREDCGALLRLQSACRMCGSSGEECDKGGYVRLQPTKDIVALLVDGACLHVEDLPQALRAEVILMDEKVVRRLRKNVVRGKDISGKMLEILRYDDLRVFMNGCGDNVRVGCIRKRFQRPQQRRWMGDRGFRKGMLHLANPPVGLLGGVAEAEECATQFFKRLRAPQDAEERRFLGAAHERVAKRHRREDAGVEYCQILIVAGEDHFALVPDGPGADCGLAPRS